MEDINSILSKVGLKCTKQRISVAGTVGRRRTSYG